VAGLDVLLAALGLAVAVGGPADGVVGRRHLVQRRPGVGHAPGGQHRHGGQPDPGGGPAQADG
jgi:hypothetical protein